MNNSAFSLGEKLKVRDITYYLYRAHWEKFTYPAIDLSLGRWTTFKYLSVSGKKLSASIQQLPTDRGGLYLFTIRSGVLPGITEFPVYVGRAKLTEGQNLRKRCKEYFTHHRKDKERPLINRMFKYWAKDLYLSFLVLDDNDTIVDYEKKLINSLVLPFNEEIPDVQLRQAKKAFKL